MCERAPGTSHRLDPVRSRTACVSGLPLLPFPSALSLLCICICICAHTPHTRSSVRLCAGALLCCCLSSICCCSCAAPHLTATPYTPSFKRPRVTPAPPPPANSSRPIRCCRPASFCVLWTAQSTAHALSALCRSTQVMCAFSIEAAKGARTAGLSTRLRLWTLHRSVICVVGMEGCKHTAC